jgi:hypothetical protein
MLGDDRSNAIIAYGGGKFNPSSPGYKPSPTRSSYFANRLKKVHNATVLKYLGVQYQPNMLQMSRYSGAMWR